MDDLEVSIRVKLLNKRTTCNTLDLPSELLCEMCCNECDMYLGLLRNYNNK